MSKVVLIIQARMGSKRLPGKSVLNLVGAPLLGRILERVKRCKCFSEIVLAIPKKKEDEILREIGNQYSIEVFSGSENDLLDRYYRAALFYKADYIARLPADNPTPEPNEIDKLIKFHLKFNKFGFSSNLSPFFNSGYPDGIGIEIFNFNLLEEVHKRNKDPIKREHLHLNFFDYKNEKAVDFEWCPIKTINCPKEFKRPELVLDVNTYEQYLFMKELYEYNYKKNNNFTIIDTVKWYENIYLKKIKF